MTTRPPNSPDWLFQSVRIQGTVDEEGFLDNGLTPKDVRETLADAGLDDVKTVSSKALIETVDSYHAGVYHTFRDKRFLSSLEK